MSRPSVSSARVLGPAALALLGLVHLAAPRPAAAALRVYDAPAAQGGAARGGRPPAIPPAPAEYLTDDRGWITFVYHPSTRDRVRPLIARVDAFRAELGALLGREALTAHVEVRVAAAPAELEHLTPSVEIGDATAVTFGDLRLAAVSAAPRVALDPPQLEGVLRHALAHLALDEAAGEAAIPRWMHEGFAVHAAGDRAAVRAQTLSLAALRGRLLPLADLPSLLPAEAPETSVAYAEAADFVRFLVEREGREGRADRPDHGAHRAHGDDPQRTRFAGFLAEARAGAPLDDALTRSYGARLADLELAWRQDVARRYGFVPVLVGTLALLTLLCAGALGLRRLRDRRARPAPPRLRARPEVELPRVSRPSRNPATPILASRAGRRRAEGDVESDVPKIEHGGRWYTLH